MLSGAELAGIAVWRDANSNGVSDAGEVIPAEEFGIVEIVVAGHEVGGTLMQERGIRLGDGSVVATFDWTPESLPDNKHVESAGEHGSAGTRDFFRSGGDRTHFGCR